jgi:23S rRNA pseudouridine1911/1915/1917 synthase
MHFSVEPNTRVTFKVRYEDEDLIVVDKPPGLVTQPGLGHERDTLLNGLFARCGPKLQNLGKARDFGLLHRLDRQASGLLLVGLRPAAYDALRKAFEERTIRKFYWAITKGKPRTPTGVIRRPLIETVDEKKLARLSSAGKPAVTAYRVVQTSPHASLIEARPVTGRLHQVRVHLDSIGCAILGDDLYGPTIVRNAAPRVALHAHRLVFTHPSGGNVIDVRSPWPKDLTSVLKRMGLSKPEMGEPSSGGAASGGGRWSVQGREEIDGDPVGQHEPGVGEDPAPG